MASARHRIFALLVLALWIPLLLAVAEAGLRYISKSSSRPVFDEKNLSYRYDAELGWFPRENGDVTVTGISGIVFRARHNQLGFRDVEHSDKRRPRIAVLGDSFVWGYDVEAGERFTDSMQRLLPDWEIINMGVSGYGTDQEYLLLQRFYDRFKPDVVVLLFFRNDHADNSSNVRYGGYYKPYFIKERGGLTVKGIPVPKSINYYYARFPGLARKSALFRSTLIAWQQLTAPPPETYPEPTVDILRALHAYVRTRGVDLVLASVYSEPLVEEFARRDAIPYMELPSYATTPSGHWTPAAHDAVGRQLAKMLGDAFPSRARTP